MFSKEVTVGLVWQKGRPVAEAFSCLCAEYTTHTVVRYLVHL